MTDHMTAETLRKQLVEIEMYARTRYLANDAGHKPDLGSALVHIANTLEQISARLSGMAEVPEGWRRVPCEPTTAMCRAGLADRHDDLARSIYRAMLDAAPNPPVSFQQAADARMLPLYREFYDTVTDHFDDTHGVDAPRDGDPWWHNTNADYATRDVICAIETLEITRPDAKKRMEPDV